MACAAPNLATALSADDDTQLECHRKLPSRYYLAVRCGNPVPSKGSWARQDKPCTFRVRYALVPQLLRGGDVVGPMPMVPSTTHGYSGIARP